MKVDLDIFEMSWLLDACLRGSHLRASTIERFVDDWYDELTEQQRYNLYEWTLRLTYGGNFKPSDTCCGADKVFMARYNPDNQYMIMVRYEGKTSKYRCFLYNGEYHVTTSRFIGKEYIKKVERYTPNVMRTEFELKHSNIERIGKN